MEIYIVQQNDTVDSIAQSYQVPVENIIEINQILYPYALAIGQALLIPTGGEAADRRSAVTNGYAYPFIADNVLAETLPRFLIKQTCPFFLMVLPVRAN